MLDLTTLYTGFEILWRKEDVTCDCCLESYSDVCTVRCFTLGGTSVMLCVTLLLFSAEADCVPLLVLACLVELSVPTCTIYDCIARQV